MKRKSVIALSSLLIASSLLASCGSSSSKVSFGMYWYKDSKTSAEVGVQEILTYDVSFEPASGIGKNYELSYNNGTYKTHFGLVEENGKTFYRLTSTLTIDVTYKFNGKEESFNDSTLSIVDFEKNSSLTPIKSSKQIVSHSPLNSNEKTDVSGCYSLVDYSVSVVYNGASGTSIVTNNATENSQTHEFEIKNADEYTYLDNEQLYFAMRGLQASTTATSFMVYAPFSKTVQEIKATFSSEVAGGEFTFIKNDDQAPSKLTSNYYNVNLALATKNPGSPQSLRIAALKNPTSNKARNLIFEISTPLSYNLGTLKYKLKSAQLF